MFGPEYTKINSAFKRDDRKAVRLYEWSTPEFEYLASKAWRWTEKVDGTNIRLHWDGSKLTIGGRTDEAQVPASLVAKLGQLSGPDLWHGIFPEADDVTVYGQYRADQALIVFDVKVAQWWLKDEDITDVAAKLGLEVVPVAGEFSPMKAWDQIQAGTLKSNWPGARIEGLVGRPVVPLFDRRGDRIIMKMKVKDWADYKRQHPGYPE